jgi:hypothetical protein
MEWPDFEIISYENRLPGKEEADPTIFCKLQLQRMAMGAISPSATREQRSSGP